MKITVKTTQQKVFQIEVESEETVAALKAKIYESQGHPAAVQKIIYSGKILTDDKTIDSCGIKEKDFLVLMVSKPKPTPTPAPTPSVTSDVATPQPTIPTAATPELTQDRTTSPPSTSDSAPSAPSSPSDTSTFLSGVSLREAISGITAMGFPEDQVLLAMRASFNNPDRAVEYLMTGLPTHLEDALPAGNSVIQTQSPVVTPPSSTNQPQNLFQLAQQQQQGGVPGPRTQPDLEALQNHPEIQLLQQRIAQNPAGLQTLIQEFANRHPAMAQLLAAHPEVLLRGIEHDDGDGDGSIPPGTQVVNVTGEERAAIERLVGLGFSLQDAAEAYFVCDKNEDLAANYLFDHLDQ